jgi:Lecithin retinol acyltransferase
MPPPSRLSEVAAQRSLRDTALALAGFHPPFVNQALPNKRSWAAERAAFHDRALAMVLPFIVSSVENGTMSAFSAQQWADDIGQYSSFRSNEATNNTLLVAEARNALARKFGGSIVGKLIGIIGAEKDQAWEAVVSALGSETADKLQQTSNLLVLAFPALWRDEAFYYRVTAESVSNLTKNPKKKTDLRAWGTCDTVGAEHRRLAADIAQALTEREWAVPDSTGLQPGDIISSNLEELRSLSGLLGPLAPGFTISHFGVYLGRGFVLEVTGGDSVALSLVAPWFKSDRDACMEKLIGGQQCRGATPFSVQRRDYQARPSEYTVKQRQETVRRAIELLGCHNYNLFLDNCESYVTYARTGHFVSHQAVRVVRVGAAAGLLATLGPMMALTWGAAAGLKNSGKRLADAWERLVAKWTRKREQLFSSLPGANRAVNVNANLKRAVARVDAEVWSDAREFVRAIVRAGEEGDKAGGARPKLQLLQLGGLFAFGRPAIAGQAVIQR